MLPLSVQFGEALLHRFSQVLYRCFEEVGSTKAALYLLVPGTEGFQPAAHFGWPRTLPPPERLRRAVRFFFRSECDEAHFRTALSDAVPLYRETRAAAVHRRLARRKGLAFMKVLRPDLSPRQCVFAADLAMTVVAAAGKAVSGQNRIPAEADALAGAVGDMLCAWLAALPPTPSPS